MTQYLASIARSFSQSKAALVPLFLVLLLCSPARGDDSTGINDGLNLELPLGVPVPDQSIGIQVEEGESWTATTGAAWLTLQQTSGVGPETVAVSINAELLSVGTLETAVTISALSGASETPVRLTVSGINLTYFEKSPASLFALLKNDAPEKSDFLVEVSPADGQWVRFLCLGNNVNAMAIAGNLNQAFFIRPGEDSSPVVDLESWSVVDQLSFDAKFDHLDSSDDGLLFLQKISLFQGEVSLFDSQTREFGTSRLFQQNIPFTKGSKDGKSFYYVSLGGNKVVKFIDDGSEFQSAAVADPSPSIQDPVQSLFFTDDESRVFAGRYGYDSDLELQSIYGSPALALDPTEEVIVGRDGLYWSRSGAEIDSFPFASDFVRFSPDGLRLVRFNSELKEFEATLFADVFSSNIVTPQPGEIRSVVPLALVIKPVPMAIGYSLYLSKTLPLPEIPVFSRGPAEDTSFQLDGLLDPFGVYYWRIDAETFSGRVTGETASFDLVLPPELSSFPSSFVDAISVGPNEILVANTSSVDPALAVYPASGDLPAEGEAIFTNRTPFGSLSSNLAAQAGGRLYAGNDVVFYQYEKNSEGFWNRVATLEPQLENGFIGQIESAGDLLFLRVETFLDPDVESVVEVYHTYPELRYLETLERPAGTGDVAGFGTKMAVSDDCVILTNGPGRYRLPGNQTADDDQMRLFVYERDPASGEWAHSQTETFPGTYEGDHAIGFDGQQAVLSVLETENPREPAILVYEREGSGQFTFQSRALIGEFGFPGIRSMPSLNRFRNIVTSVKVEGDLLAFRSPTGTPRFNHGGAIYILEKISGSWVPKGSLSISENNGRTDAGSLEISDGFIYAGLLGTGDFSSADGFLARFDLTEGVNPRPKFETLPFAYAAAGQSYRSETLITDDAELDVTIQQGPGWLQVAREGDVYVLTGTPPANAGVIEEVRVLARDSGGRTNSLTFDLIVLGVADAPMVAGSPEAMSLKVGKQLILGPVVSGREPLVWQWFFNGEPLAGETSPSLVLDAVDTEDGGKYTYSVNNAAGSLLSDPITVAVVPADRFGGNWTTYGSSVFHLGHHPAALGTHFFIPDWERRYPLTRIISRALQVDGRIYHSEQARPGTGLGLPPLMNRIFALDADTGDEIWSIEPGGGTINPPTYFEGRLYVQVNGREEGDLIALDAESGDTIWRAPFALQSGTYREPAVTAEGIYINGGRFGGLYAYEPDGTERFFSNTSGTTLWTPTFRQGRLFSWVDNLFTEFDKDTGERVWELFIPAATEGFIRSSGVVAALDGSVILTAPGQVIHLDINSREILWESSSPIGEIEGFTDAAIYQNKVFVLTSAGASSFDLQTGDLLRNYEIEDVLSSNDRIASEVPLLLNDHLIFATLTQTFIFSVETGKLLQTLPVGGMLSFSNGRLLISGFEDREAYLHSFFANDIPDFVNDDLPDATEDVEYLVNLAADHNDSGESLTYRKVSGPAWLSVTPQGQVSGSFGNIPAITATLVVEVSDGVTPPNTGSFSITMIAVNDPPKILTQLRGVIANPAADPSNVDLATAFIDPDPGDSLSFSIFANSNPAIFSSLEINQAEGVLILNYADYQSGASEITVRATDQEGVFIEQTFSVTLPELPDPLIEQIGEVVLNPRTGLHEQKIAVTNTAGRAIGGFILNISGLSDGYQLRGFQENEISYLKELPGGEVVNLVLEYHSAISRNRPNPVIAVSKALPQENLVVANPGETSPEKILPLADQSILLEFPTEVGQTYRIQYSLDLENWTTSPVAVIAAANRTVWIDQGPPKTDCHPRDCQMRIYRVVKAIETTNQ